MKTKVLVLAFSLALLTACERGPTTTINNYNGDGGGGNNGGNNSTVTLTGKDTVYDGDPDTLLVTAPDADTSWGSLFMNNGVGNVRIGFVVVYPVAPKTTYVVTSLGPKGTMTASKTVTVISRPLPKAPACNVTGSPLITRSNGISAGTGKSTLHITKTGGPADSTFVNNVLIPAGVDTADVSPMTTGPQTVSMKGPGGSGSCAVIITVKPPAPWGTILFVADSIVIGGSTQILLTGMNATKWSLNQWTGPLPIDTVEVTPPLSAPLWKTKLTFSPTVTTEYVLHVENSIGEFVDVRKTLKVIPR